MHQAIACALAATPALAYITTYSYAAGIFSDEVRGHPGADL